MCGELPIFLRNQQFTTQAGRRIIFCLTAPDLDKEKEERDFEVLD